MRLTEGSFMTSHTDTDALRRALLPLDEKKVEGVWPADGIIIAATKKNRIKDPRHVPEF